MEKMIFSKEKYLEWCRASGVRPGQYANEIDGKPVSFDEGKQWASLDPYGVSRKWCVPGSENPTQKKYTMKDFVEKKIAVTFKDSAEQQAFLKACEAAGLLWRNNKKPTAFQLPQYRQIECDYYGDGLLTHSDPHAHEDEGWQTIAFSDLDLSPARADDELHITVKGRETHAVWKKGGKVIGHGIATCSPGDEFDFRKGAELAMRRAGFAGVERFKEDNAVREVKRPAKKGEQIKIIDPWLGFSRPGDVLTVHSTTTHGHVYVAAKDHPQRGTVSSLGDEYLWVHPHSEYVVLEPITEATCTAKPTR